MAGNPDSVLKPRAAHPPPPLYQPRDHHGPVDFEVIELLDDDDENDNVIDLCNPNLKPNVSMRRQRKRNRRPGNASLPFNGEVQVVGESIPNGPKPPPVASLPSSGEVQILEAPFGNGPGKPNSSVASSTKLQPLGGDSNKVAAATPTKMPPSNVLRVLEIFPDADIDFVRKKLREQKDNFEVVVSVLLENKTYPKSKKKTTMEVTPGGDAQNSSNHTSNTIIRGLTMTQEPKHDYSSPSASLEISQKYCVEAINVLLYDFSFLKKTAICALFTQNSERYTLTRNCIHDMIVGKGNPNVAPAAAAAAGSAAAAKLEQEETENYRLLRSVLKRGVCPKDVQQRMGKSYCLNRPRKKISVATPAISDPVLLDEHYWFERKFQQWLATVQDRLRGQAENKLALENGTAVECGCCFDDVAVTECVPCKQNGHLFCKACIVLYVENQVFGSGNLGIDQETKKPALEIKCCSGSGCNSGFPEEMLQKVLPVKTWEKYSEMQARAQIDRAGLGENLAHCPKCGYQAFVPETQNIFECPVQGCGFESCRKCGKAAHIPLRCEEVQQQNRRDQGRLKIEEALSEAKMRTCPKCSKKFIKSDGCNKMTCACGMKMCYVCRKPLDKIKGGPYTHFCQVPHCDHSSCGKCKLYSNDAEDDALAMREAGIAAKEAYEAKLQNEEQGSSAVQDLQLDVDEMMFDPSKPKAKKRKTRRR